MSLAKHYLGAIKHVITYILSFTTRIQTYHQICRQMGLRQTKIKTDVKTM